MDIEKLIDGLKNSKGPDNCHDCTLGYWVLMGATALSTLQAENEKLRAELEQAKEAQRRTFNEAAVLNLAGQALGITPDRLRELAQADREERHA